jgi:hypothetical protein
MADRMDRMPGHQLTTTGEAAFSAMLALGVDTDMEKAQDSTSHEVSVNSYNLSAAADHDVESPGV